DCEGPPLLSWLLVLAPPTLVLRRLAFSLLLLLAGFLGLRLCRWRRLRLGLGLRLCSRWPVGRGRMRGWWWLIAPRCRCWTIFRCGHGPAYWWRRLRLGLGLRLCSGGRVSRGRGWLIAPRCRCWTIFRCGHGSAYWWRRLRLGLGLRLCSRWPVSRGRWLVALRCRGWTIFRCRHGPSWRPGGGGRPAGRASCIHRAWLIARRRLIV